MFPLSLFHDSQLCICFLFLYFCPLCFFPPCLSRSVSASLCHVEQPSSLQQSVKLWWPLNTFITYVTLISDVSLVWCVFAASGGSTKNSFPLFFESITKQKTKGSSVNFSSRNQFKQLCDDFCGSGSILREIHLVNAIRVIWDGFTEHCIITEALIQTGHV